MFKKYSVLVILFVLPIMIYLFFATGIYHFKKLPIVVKNVVDISEVTSESQIRFEDKITVLGFLGGSIQSKRVNILNLYKKVYDRFYKFDNFQFVMIIPVNTEADVKNIHDMENLMGVDTSQWKFVYSRPAEIKQIFIGLRTPHKLDEHLSTDYVYIIDKDKNLRGRVTPQNKFGYNASSSAEISSMMVDDVKVLLAEYRLVSKKNRNLKIVY